MPQLSRSPVCVPAADSPTGDAACLSALSARQQGRSQLRTANGPAWLSIADFLARQNLVAVLQRRAAASGQRSAAAAARRDAAGVL